MLTEGIQIFVQLFAIQECLQRIRNNRRFWLDVNIMMERTITVALLCVIAFLARKRKPRRNKIGAATTTSMSTSSCNNGSGSIRFATAATLTDANFANSATKLQTSALAAGLLMCHLWAYQ